MKDDRERIQHMLEAIERIHRYATDTDFESLKGNELLQTWFVYHLQIIGEAASKLSAGVRESRQNIPWSEIIAMRNILVHEYFGVDVKEVWDTIQRDLPRLKRQLQELLDTM